MPPRAACRHIGILLCLAVLAASSLAGCGRPGQRPVTKITIAFQEWVGYGLFYLAQEMGFCNDEGIELVFVNEELDAARRDAFMAGMLDCEAGTIDLLVSKRSQDVPIQMVMALDESYGADGIVAVKEIRSFADLVDKKVALAPGDVGDTFLSYLFYEANLPFDAVEIVPERPGRVAAAFLEGMADAAATWEPELSRALVRQGSHILVSTRQRPGIIIDTLNVREDIVRDSPALVRAVMRAWFRALAYYREHPDEASTLIAGHYRMSPEEYRKAVEGLRWIGYDRQVLPEQYVSWTTLFDQITAIKMSRRQLSRKPDAAAAIDDHLLKGLYETGQ